MNLLTYAQARRAIYGPTQEAVTAVRHDAKSNPRTLGRFRLRPPRIWVTEESGADRQGGVRTFRSTYRGHTVRRSMFLSDRGGTPSR